MAQNNLEAKRQIDAQQWKRVLESLRPDLSKPGSLIRLAVFGTMAVGLAGGAIVGVREIVKAIDWDQATVNRDAWLGTFFEADIPPSHQTSIQTVGSATVEALQELTPTLLPPTPTPWLTETPTPVSEISLVLPEKEGLSICPEITGIEQLLQAERKAGITFSEDTKPVKVDGDIFFLGSETPELFTNSGFFTPYGSPNKSLMPVSCAKVILDGSETYIVGFAVNTSEGTRFLHTYFYGLDERWDILHLNSIFIPPSVPEQRLEAIQSLDMAGLYIATGLRGNYKIPPELKNSLFLKLATQSELKPTLREFAITGKVSPALEKMILPLLVVTRTK